MAKNDKHSLTAMAELTVREYLTPEQCERLFPHSASWWRRAFDEGLVNGYRENEGPKAARYLLAGKVDIATGAVEAGSCRALLRQIGKQQRADEDAISRKRLGGGRRAKAALALVDEASRAARERVKRELAEAG